MKVTISFEDNPNDGGDAGDYVWSTVVDSSLPYLLSAAEQILGSPDDYPMY